MCAALLLAVPAAPSAEETAKEVSNESGLYYTIEKGDTLWDLSRRFFDSPDLWPELWQRNGEIPNPHWIYPGEQIRLYRQEGLEKVKEPEKIGQPAVQKPEIAKALAEAPKKEPPYYYFAPIQTVGFIRKEAVEPSGTIFRSQSNDEMISEGDIVYISPGAHTMLYPGATYTVYRTIAGFRTKKYADILENPGVQHYFTGVVEILKEDADYYVGRVIRSYRAIRVNDLLMPFRPRSPKIVLAKSTEGIAGRVLFNENRDRMFADSDIAFIDKGKQDGIEVGQFYSVYYEDIHGLFKFGEERERYRRSVETPVDFAKVLVLLTEETTSTVLVTYSEKDIYPTARIRTPVRQ